MVEISPSGAAVIASITSIGSDRKTGPDGAAAESWKAAGIAPGRLALIAGDEVDASDASTQAVRLADLLAAPVYGSSWPAHIPFPTAHPLWEHLRAGGHGRALGVEHGDERLAAEREHRIVAAENLGDAARLGRQIAHPDATQLSTVGNVRASLDVLLPLLETRLAPRAETYARLRSEAVSRCCGGSCADARASPAPRR
jgi:benzoylformate decarboxylase